LRGFRIWRKIRGWTPDSVSSFLHGAGKMWIVPRFGVLSACLAALSVAAPAASADCGLCAKKVVVNSSLASCFLEKYQRFSGDAGGPVAIDLEDCEEERGVVAALRGPGTGPLPPSRRFMLSLSQLACLKSKLEEPGLVLDPSLEIDLGSCQ